MADLFKIYEQSLGIVLKTINDTIYTPNPKERQIEHIHSNILEAKRILKQMDLELANADKSSELYRKYKTYCNKVDDFDKQYNKIEEKYINDKNLRSWAFDIEHDNKKMPVGLIEAEEGSNKWFDMKREAYSIENTGKNIKTELDGQGQKIRSMRENLYGLNEDIENNNSLLNRMLRRENRNRWILGFCGGICVVIISVIIYFKIGE